MVDAVCCDCDWLAVDVAHGGHLIAYASGVHGQARDLRTL
jgi:hypothetical protein